MNIQLPDELPLLRRSLGEEKGFGLDLSNVAIEKFPLLINPVSTISLKRRAGTSLRHSGNNSQIA